MSNTIETPAGLLRVGDIIRLYNYGNARIRRFEVNSIENALGRPALRVVLSDVRGATVTRYFAATRLVTREQRPS